MSTISALYVIHNEEELIKGSIQRVLPFVDEVIVLDHGCTDDSIEMVKSLDREKIKIITRNYQEPVDMGEVRTQSLRAATGDWIWQIDADEYYPEESCKTIRDVVENADKEISFRVPYYNVAWRYGHVQSDLEHYPDRLYRRDVVDKYDGILPNDMTLVKEEHYNHRPFLEYDNPEDKSFENPVQPIIQAPFYHLARARGYNYEFNKWLKYNGDPAQARINQWVTGLYEMKPHETPEAIIKNPKVSVIIPNFQQGHYIGDAIRSIENQTHGAHEIVVVDDRSHDNSIQKIHQHKVDLIALKENGGVANARNVGISQSTGDYFICLDADDKLEPTFIEKTLAKMKKDVQVVFTDLKFFGNQNETVSYPDFSLEELKKNQCVPSACALIDRRVFEAVGGFDNGEWYEDYGWWLRIATKGFNFAQVKEPLFHYRKHGDSRITMLDQKQEQGFKQLKDRYGKII